MPTIGASTENSGMAGADFGNTSDPKPKFAAFRRSDHNPDIAVLGAESAKFACPYLAAYLPV